jgi:hypothetical protein
MTREITDKNGEDNLKIFTMRNIPENLRKRWKIVCTIESITMEEFAVKAIAEKVDRYSQERLQSTLSVSATEPIKSEIEEKKATLS